MSDSKSQDLQRDDIDLLALLERSLSFFRKYKWIFITATIVGLLLGFLRYRSLPVFYKSRLILQSNILSNPNNIQIVANWNTLLKAAEYSYLAQVFNCSEDILHKVKELKAEEIQKIFTPQNPNGFYIDVMVTDVAMLDDLQKGILYGFDNNESVKDRLAARRKRLQELIDKSGVELNRLDSSKRILESILSGKKTSSSLIIDVTGISRQLLTVNEQHLLYKEELNFATAVQVLQNFQKFKRPAGHNLWVSLFLGLVSCLALAYLYALFHSINQQLKSRARLLKAS